MREFPRNVFTSPGKNTCQGGSYGSELVQNEKEMTAALGAGFFETIPEALEALTKPKKETMTPATPHGKKGA